MTTNMVDLPWHDGTTRTVPEWTAYKAANGQLHFARNGGYSNSLSPEEPFGIRLYRHYEDSAAVRIFTEAPEPPVKVEVPTGIGAIVSVSMFPNLPGFVLMGNGWRGLRSHAKNDPSFIADQLRDGARVLFEGIEED